MMIRLTYEQIEQLEEHATTAHQEPGPGDEWRAMGRPENILALIQEMKRLRGELPGGRRIFVAHACPGSL